MSTPSFSSFPPSFASFPNLAEHSGTKSSKKLDDLNLREGKKDEKHGKKRKDSDKETGKKRKRNHDSEYIIEDRHLKIKEDSKHRTHEESSRFYSDRKGDHYNIEYGRLHAGDVPKYHAVDRGRNILGLSSAWMATHRSSKGIEVSPRGQRKMSSLTDSSSRALLAVAPIRRVLQSNDMHKYQEVDGFLRLTSGHRQNKSEQPYRSILFPKDGGGANSDSETSEASEYNSDGGSSANESDTLTLTSHQLTLKELDQQLEEDPTSIDKWLYLLSHTLSTIPVTSKNATTARSEITLSIIGRALAADARNRDSQILRLKYMKAGEEVWHESKVKAEWETSLKVGSVEIWMEWLEWRIRKGNDGIDGVVKDAVRIINTLGNTEQDEMAKVRVFWRVAVTFQNAGFSERAIAMFQAQAELTFSIPPALRSLPHEAQMDQLEEFWESEAPRTGEESAGGWAAWMSSTEKHQKIYHMTNTATTSIVELDPYRQWAARELQADRTLLLPSRSSEESSDPYSTIFFSDIRSLLIQFRSAPAKNAFRIAWLSVLGLYIPGFSASLSSETNWDDRWNLCHLNKPSYLAALFHESATQTRLATEAVAGVIVGREKEYASSFGPIRCWGYGVIDPLDVRKGSTRVGLWGPEDVEGIDERFVRGMFAQLRLGEDDVEWDILALAFEAAINIKNAIKHSRLLLSKKASILHWAAHAQLEIIRGRPDEARKIYQTVLFMSNDTSSMKGASLIWWRWAEMEWLARNTEQALHIILRAANVEGQGSVAVLRCKRRLDDAIKDETSWKDREGWIKMRALLELLIGNEPPTMLALFDDYLSKERKKDVPHESLTISCLIMLYNHGIRLKNPMPPSVLRQRVENALEDYPSNTLILGLFLEGERGQGIWGRVRGLLGESGRKMKDVTRRVQEVWIAGWERGRWTGEIERTRGGLAAAVENERTRASHIIWRVYIEFEIQTGQLQRAKKLLFRAIGECPLVKELYLLGFGPLRGVFNGQELNKIADTMAERGLRLRQGIDDTLAGWKNMGEIKEENSESEDDELTENARELRRLMPY